MACLYYVNGNWISENQFKELLNNGLLDNLIKDKKLDLKGFKLDSSKLIETKTEEVTTSTISAVKLASILAEEVKGRSGYPINMLSALELNTVRNADGTINEELTDFKIPLWASPYASKFESLLTSLVSNKVIKQKLPGNSYVLGSEEGFKIKEGDAAAGDLKNSNIVFTEKFDASKGLQPLRWDPEAKKMLPAQIMIPFKFRDESGKILDLKQFTIKGPDGRVMLDMEKIPEKLLMLFGFRIPTQKQNSMAAVEVVGFLPETSGDLILAPRDFTNQMGSDFDVDKLYTYMYNHYFLNGKLYTNFVSDTKKINKLLEIAKQQLENIKIEYKLSKEEKKLIDKYIKEKSEADERGEPVSSELAQKVSALIEESMTVERGKGYPILEEFKEKIDNAVNTISVLNRSYKAARQNNILDIHLKVMLSSNPEVISAILALDSSGDFKKLSEDIYRVRVERGLVDPIVSILSETYQRTKFINATAGKNGVGYFSLDSTFNASAQGKELVYDNLTDEVRDDLYQNGRPTYQQVLENNMPVATFGESVSKGDLSNKYTLRSQLIIDKAKAEGRELTSEEKASLKLKSLVIRSLQSASVDNEKEQILDKLNISDETIHAIRALTILGFEEDEISGLLTQEIIWEFVENIKEAGSSLSPYNANAKEDVFKALTLKYDPEGKFDELSIINLTLLQGQSAEKLLDNVFSDIKKLKVPENKVTPDYNLEQLALLQKFMRLSEIGLQINAVQSAVNSESKGVPTSLIETRAKVEQINNLSSSPIFNAMNLIGKTSIEDGVRKVTPNNINGFAAMYGTFFANDIFKKYFPYDSQGFKTIVSEITAHMPARSSMSVSAATQLKKDVFSEIKSYLFANSNTNLFNGNPDFARRILFIDNQENTSLARKLSMLQSQTWFQRNGFLNKLDFDLNKNGQPSRVNFEAATGENFDERNIYDGFIYLIDKNFAVGTFKVDGKDVEYTSRMLAQELVTAAYLEGGMQGAKQYLKYIPNAYLKTIGFGEYLQGVEFDFQSNFFGTIPESGPGYTYGMPSRFTRQFFQNNPDKSKTVTFGMIEGNPTKIPDSFVIKKDLLGSNFIQVSDHISGEPTLEQTKFVSIYDTKLPGKYALYEFDSVARIYRRIPTLLGSYGFVQYNSERGTVVPLEAINSTTSPLPEIATPGYELKNIPTAPTKEFTTGVVNNPTPVVESNNLNLSENLSGTKEALDDLLNVLADSSSISTLHSHLIETLRELELPADFKLIYDNNILGRGSFRASDNTLIINLKHPQNQAIDNLANVVTHELIHAHTSKVITLYQMGNLSSLTQKQIQSIQKLEALQATYIENLVKEEGSERLKQFNQLFNNWKVAEVKSGRSSVEAANEFKKLQNFLKAGDLSKYYGAIKLTEFVTMALTDTGFQERLNNIKDAEGISMWTKIKEAILDILNALGLDVQPGSALAYAIKDSMDLIQANQEELKKNLIETKEFIEFGTKYRFEVNSEGNVTKAEFAQGNYTVFKPMNKTNAKKTYDRLSKSSVTQVTTPSKVNTTLVNDSSKFTTQPSTSVENLADNKYEIFPGVFTNQGQTAAIDKMTNFLVGQDKTFLLKGRGGTGKTTIVKMVMDKSNIPHSKILGATVSDEARGILADNLPSTIKTKTIASALGLVPDFNSKTGELYFRERNIQEQKDFDARGKSDAIENAELIIIDEASMVGEDIYDILMRKKRPSAKVIFMGDNAQIPPIMPDGSSKDSPVFKLLEGTKTFAELTQRMRQGEESPILPVTDVYAENIESMQRGEQGKENPLTSRISNFDPNTNSGVIFTNNRQEIVDGFVADFQNNPDNLKNAVIIGARNEVVDNFAQLVRNKLFDNPSEPFVIGDIIRVNSPFVQGKEVLYANGFKGKVIAVESSGIDPLLNLEKFFITVEYDSTDNSGITSRKTTRMTTISPQDKKSLKSMLQALAVKAKNKQIPWQTYYQIKESIVDLGYNYAMTSHKVQGSTYQNVYILEEDIMSFPGGRLQRNRMIYTAVSRPTTKLVVYSSKSTPITKKGLDMGVFTEAGINPEALSQKPAEDTYYGEENTFRSEEKNTDYYDDYEAYRRMKNSEDDMIEESPLNSDAIRNYLLICGK
jgi:exodeoxyribonuclease-5